MKNISVILGLVMATGVCAADGFMPWSDVAKMYDDNNDGKVSMSEVKSMAHVLGKGFEKILH